MSKEKAIRAAEEQIQRYKDKHFPRLLAAALTEEGKL